MLDIPFHSLSLCSFKCSKIGKTAREMQCFYSLSFEVFMFCNFPFLLLMLFLSETLRSHWIARVIVIVSNASVSQLLQGG